MIDRISYQHRASESINRGQKDQENDFYLISLIIIRNSQILREPKALLKINTNLSIKISFAGIHSNSIRRILKSHRLLFNSFRGKQVM